MELRTTPQPVNLAENGIYVFESRHAPGFEMEMGKWAFDKLCFIRQGRGSVESETFKKQLEADQIVFLPAGIAHRFADDPANPITLIMICFYPDDLRSVPGLAGGYTYFRSAFAGFEPLGSNQTHRRAAIMASLQRMVFEQTTARQGFESVIWGLLAHLLVMLARSATESSAQEELSQSAQAFARTLDFLEERFTEPVQIKDLAAMAGLSYRRYTTLFKQSKGMTVNAYLTSIRIEFAKKRLLETGNVLFSALEAGFGDLSHFYRVFKQATGQTPKSFIEGQTTD